MPRSLPQPNRASLDLTQILCALGDPVRLAMLRAIDSAEQPIECAAISVDAAVSPSTVSHHFRVLREAGLTTTVVEGRRRRVSVRSADVDARFPGLLEAVLHAPVDA